MTKPVAGYYRISKERGEMIAPEVYEQKIQSYCTAHGLQLAHFFSDIDVSGRAEAWGKRRGLQELLSRTDEFSAVVAPSFSRFGRSTRDVLNLFHEFDGAGLDLHTVDEQISTAGPYGEFARTMLVALAALQSNQISESWQDTFDNILAKGRVPGAAWVPYGYLYDKATKNMVPDPETAPIVQEVFTRFLRGETGAAIATDLNNRSIPFERRIREEGGGTKIMRTGKRKWWSDSVHRMIEQPMYVGRGQRKRKDGTVQKFVGAWEPLVTEETWKAANHQRRETKTATPREGRGSHLLSGILSCGKCGKNLHYIARGENGDLYTCRNKLDGEAFDKRCTGGGISATRAEAFVKDTFLRTVPWSRLRELIQKFAEPSHQPDLSPRRGELERQLQNAVSLQVRAPGPEAAAAYTAEIEDLQRQLNDVDDAVLKAETSPETIRRQLGHLDGYFERMVTEFPEFWDTEHDLPADFDERYWTALAEMLGWDDLTEVERRQLLAQAIDRVVVKSNGKRGRNTKSLHVDWKPWLDSVTSP